MIRVPHLRERLLRRSATAKQRHGALGQGALAVGALTALGTIWLGIGLPRAGGLSARSSGQTDAPFVASAEEPTQPRARAAPVPKTVRHRVGLGPAVAARPIPLAQVVDGGAPPAGPAPLVAPRARVETAAAAAAAVPTPAAPEQPQAPVPAPAPTTRADPGARDLPTAPAPTATVVVQQPTPTPTLPPTTLPDVTVPEVTVPDVPPVPALPQSADVPPPPALPSLPPVPPPPAPLQPPSLPPQ